MQTRRASLSRILIIFKVYILSLSLAVPVSSNSSKTLGNEGAVKYSMHTDVSVLEV